MVISDIQKAFATAGLGLTFVLAVLGGIYHVGAEAGRSDVQTEFDAYKLAESAQLIAVNKANAAAELRHRQETTAIEVQLRKTEDDYEATVAALRSDYAVRLRTSDQRAAVYQRLSASGPAACSDLAGHAAGLDRSLEAGRSLVGELRSTLVLREDQLKALGAIIVNDRQLVGVAQ